MRRPKANGNEIAGVKAAYPWMARHRFLLGVFVSFRRKPRSNHHWLKLATKLTLELDHSSAQNVSAILIAPRYYNRNLLCPKSGVVLARRALDALGATYLKRAAQIGMDPALLHRVAVIGSGTLDSLPHNGAVVTLLSVCGSTHSARYKDIFHGRHSWRLHSSP